MSKFTNITTSGSPTTLLQASDHAVSGNKSLVGSRFFSVNKITIVNYDNAAANVTLYQSGLTVDSVTY